MASAAAGGVRALGRGLATAGKTAASAAAGGVRRLVSGLGSLGRAGISGIRSVAGHIANIGARARSARSGVGSLGASIRNVGLVAAGLRIAGAAMGRFRSLVRSAISENSTLQAQCDSLKSALSQALAPAIGVVMQALSAIMPYILGVSNAIGSLIANLFGTGWQSVASGATAAAAATSGAAAAQREYNRTVAGFDEITKLDSSSGGGGGGGSGGGGSGEVATQTITGKLPQWLTDLGAKVKAAIEAGDWTAVGSALASKLGEGVEYARTMLNSPAFRSKCSAIVSHTVDTINGFFGTLTEDDGAGSIAGNIGGLIGDAVGLALNSADQFLTGVNWTNIGTAISQGINGAVQSLSGSVSFGQVIGDMVNAGIQSAAGIVRTLDWKALGSELARNANDLFSTVDWGGLASTISGGITGALATINTALQGFNWAGVGTAIRDFIANIDWAGIVSGLAEAFGSFAGGLATTLWTAIRDGITSAYEYFTDSIEECGGNVIAGIGQGIINWLADVGTWMYNNIWTPFVNGFKSTFSIASPSTSPTIQGLGSDLIHGLFNGIVSWLGGIVSWLKQNVWGKIVNGFQTLFNNNPIKVSPDFEVADPTYSRPETEFSIDYSGTGGRIHSGSGVKIPVTGEVTSMEDGRSAAERSRGFGIRGQVKSADTSKVPAADKILHGGGLVAERMSDHVPTSQKVINGNTAKLSGIRDSIPANQKIINGNTAKLSSAQDSIPYAQKVINAVSRFNSSADALSTGNRTLGTIAKFNAKPTDALTTSQRTIAAIAQMVRATDAVPVSQKTISVYVRPVAGWSGSLARYLGIQTIMSTITLKMPKISVLWDSYNYYGTRMYYPYGFRTYYARGGILNGATLLGVDALGNSHIAGEAGKEAVLPLEHHTEWMDKIAEKTARLLGGGGPTTIDNRIILDGRVVARSTQQIWREEARNGGDPLAGIA